nr:Keratin-associated protein like [Ipomoea batatas]GMD69465.1 Keratin-associated protein like [Ipomoea batatas]
MRRLFVVLALMMMMISCSCLVTGRQVERKLMVEDTDENDNNGYNMKSGNSGLDNHHFKPRQDFYNNSNNNNGNGGT